MHVCLNGGGPAVVSTLNAFRAKTLQFDIMSSCNVSGNWIPCFDFLGTDDILVVMSLTTWETMLLVWKELQKECFPPLSPPVPSNLIPRDETLELMMSEMTLELSWKPGV